ncbi:hypothetical protein HDU85_000521 [Gaertneriomyces sp. JEL0708]|nr:hypothetical protein HDU85_000521 [Gaertneriomyces sp. JEL0708]
MSEYWKSNKKYYCTFCGIYIQDNKISRQNHENGRKHKDTVALYLRDQTKKQQEKSEEDKETQAMLARIEQEAGKKYASDIGGPAATSRPRWDPKEEAEKDRRRALARAEMEARIPALKKAKEAEATIAPQPSPRPDGDHPYGGWSVVETPVLESTTQNQPAATSARVDEWAHYGEDEPEDTADTFTIQEKTVDKHEEEEEQSDAPVAFKKRKVGGNKTSRNTRKRVE